ncbi:MAG TPA: HAMP domain-containing sensor histidine kinase [Oligoflexia bacterium]|nr:HAMP domain-containing sensor histidine kinase [Oligoflexia bacterium]HMP26370.1 HAMP domain-containing sensor histidine kinase [Oligoflexia bacterium]
MSFSRFSKLQTLKIFLAIFWALFTSALAIWWYMFGIRQVAELRNLGGEFLAQAERSEKMLRYEGLALIGLLLAGSSWLIWLLHREYKHKKLLEEFFMTFTHELRTPLASLKLQSESLAIAFDNASSADLKKLLNRLIADTERLGLKLDNSLYLSTLAEAKLFAEKICLSEFFKFFGERWPSLKINLKGDAHCYIDNRVLESIFNNLFQNSLIHGKATEVFLDVAANDTKKLFQLNYSDNGAEFQGEPKGLGVLFARRGTTSGSAIGLYVVKKLIQKSGGQVEFVLRGGRLAANISLPVAA